MNEVLRSPSFAFDLEGPLVNLEDFHQKAFADVANRLGVVFGKEQFKNFVGAGDAAISQAIAEMIGSNDSQKIRTLKVNVYQDMIHSECIEPREGASEYLIQAKALGGDLVITSLTPNEEALRILTVSGLKPFFRYILTENSVAKRKPDPEVYIKAAELLRVRPEHMLVHEDSPTGVASAKAAGAAVAAFPVHENLVFNPQPDAIYFSWIDLNPREVYDKLMSSQK
jgi:beta-phosphoglucomutase